VLARLAVDLFPFLFLRSWTVPTVQNIPIDSAAVGAIVLALAIYGAWRSARSADGRFFIGLAVFGLLARAEWAPLARAMQKLPLFDVALNERFSFAAVFALAILAALAWRRCSGGPTSAGPRSLYQQLP